MGNRLFILPPQKKLELHDLAEWGNLKNKYSGKTLFRSELYHLETGDLSVLDIINNRWFYEELFAYLRTSHDMNLLPALKKIAGSERFNESIRQHASEIEEIIEDRIKKDDHPKSLSEGDENEKTSNALKILAGTRYPHTTEILRLLRDKSPELKRLALFLIGKFKMTDMIQDVCRYLDIPDVQEDVVSVLISFGSVAGKELERCYLATSGNAATNKAVLRVLSKVHPAGFFADRLWSSSRQIRELVLKTLLDLGYNVNDSEKERLRKDIFETFGILAWIVSAQVCLIDNDNGILSAEMQKEYNRWKDFLLGLLLLTYDKVVTDERQKSEGDNDSYGGSINELAEIIYSTKIKAGDMADSGSYRKKLKKLQRYFSCEVPRYKNLLEDIINRDYNHISIWTKACTLRNIAGIDEENLSQSAVALLFSPEALLREEAARLISRSGGELYATVSERIPEINRKQLDRIIEKQISDKEFIYEKVRFLSTCFSGINEDELLPLAQNTAFARYDQTTIFSQMDGSITWLFRDEKSDPEIVVNHEKNPDLGKIIKDRNNEWSFCYVLPLNTVKEFRFLNPDSSFEIFKYIDSKEE